MTQNNLIVFSGVSPGAKGETEILRARGENPKRLPNELDAVDLFEPRETLELGDILAVAIDGDEAQIVSLDRLPRVPGGMGKFRVEQIDARKGILTRDKAGKGQPDQGDEERAEETIHRRGQHTVWRHWRPAGSAALPGKGKRGAPKIAARLSQSSSVIDSRYFS